MIERRLTNRMIHLWRQLSEGGMPPFARFNPARVPDLWESCLVMVPLPRAANADLTLELGHVGATVGQLLGNEVIGRRLVQSARRIGTAAILKPVEEALVASEPVEREGQFVNARSKVVKYRSCFLPFGTASQGVTHVIVGVSWREF